MKSRKIFISTLCLVSVFLMLGCQSGDGKKTEPQTSTQTQDKQAVTSPSKYSLADTTAYQGALQLKDPTFCNNITEEAYKNACKAEVADQTRFESAIKALDKNLCSQVANKDKQAACKIQIDILLKNKENQTKQIEQNDALYKQFNDIVKSGDVAACKQLKDENLFKSCEFNILANKALTAKDESFCLKISDPAGQTECKNQVTQISGSTNN
jgi:hypothetical protein